MSRTYDFTNKVAVVTGASRGIGRAIAEGLAAGGATVVLSSRKEADLQETAKAIGSNGKVHVHPAHAAREDELNRLAEETRARFGKIDLLVNNAGTNPTLTMLADTSLDAWDKIFALNLRGYFILIRAVVPHMPEGGSILNIASTAGVRPQIGLGAYSVSKAAVIHLTRAFAFELASRKIRVNALAPGLIKTKLSKALWENDAIREEVLKHTPLGRVGDTAEVASAACYLLSNDASYVTGETLVVDGGSVI